MKNTITYCKEKLIDNDLRVTPQRLKIFCFLVESDSHLTAENVYKKVRREFSNISFDTVNRTLLCFLEKGLIKIVEGGYGPRRFDANLEPHYHFRCLNCKKNIDFECPEFDNFKIPENLKSRFRITNLNFVLEGICTECIEIGK